MKRYLILVLILVAGMSAYPQATRTERSAKKEKTAVRKTATRQSSGQVQQKSRQAEVQSQRKTATQSRNKASTQTRSRTAKQNTRTGNANSNAVSRSENSGRQGQTAVRTKINTSPQRSSAKKTRSNDPGEVSIRSTSANRVYREDKGTLTIDNGTVKRHQNDQIFNGNRFNVGHDNYSTIRRSSDFILEYRNYNNWYDDRYVRRMTYNSRYRPLSLEIRRDRFAYRRPMDYDLIWTPTLFNRFMYYYPDNTYWNIGFGDEIETISSYDVYSYIGTVKRIYGRVEEVYYSREDQNYILYLGDRFPYQDLSVVIPRTIARQFSTNPNWYFRNEYVWLVGLIDLWEDKPEIIIRDTDQIRTY